MIKEEIKFGNTNEFAVEPLVDPGRGTSGLCTPFWRTTVFFQELGTNREEGLGKWKIVPTTPFFKIPESAPELN